MIRELNSLEVADVSGGCCACNRVAKVIAVTLGLGSMVGGSLLIALDNHPYKIERIVGGAIAIGAGLTIFMFGCCAKISKSNDEGYVIVSQNEQGGIEMSDISI